MIKCVERQLTKQSNNYFDNPAINKKFLEIWQKEFKLETDKYNIGSLLAAKFIKIAKELIDWCIDRIMDYKKIESKEQKKN